MPTTESQEIVLEFAGSLADNVIDVGISFYSGVRRAYCRVVDILGGVTQIQYVMPIDGLEHTLQAAFDGTSYILYVDGLAVGQATPAAAYISEMQWVSIRQTPLNAGTTMSVSKVELSNCDMPA